MTSRTYLPTLLFAALALGCGGSGTPAPSSNGAAAAALFGAPGTTGTPCVVDDDCAGFCDRTVPGGYCTEACETQADCASGWCDGEFCFRECDSPRDCRSDEFLCFEAGPEQGVCSFDVESAVSPVPNIGAPCRADLECTVPTAAGTLQAFCAAEHDLQGRETGYVDGMCLALNCEDDAACGDGMRCVDGPISLCAPACETDDACRPNYACDDVTGSCVPAGE